MVRWVCNSKERIVAMSIATISSKGQITLPAHIRKKLGIAVSDRVEVESNEDSIIIRPMPRFLAFEGFLGKALPQAEDTCAGRGRLSSRGRGNRSDETGSLRRCECLFPILHDR